MHVLATTGDGTAVPVDVRTVTVGDRVAGVRLADDSVYGSIAEYGVLPEAEVALVPVKDTTGHAHLRWAGSTIDAYFLVGGVIFAIPAVRHRAQQTDAQRRASSLLGPH